MNSKSLVAISGGIIFIAAIMTGCSPQPPPTAPRYSGPVIVSASGVAFPPHDTNAIVSVDASPVRKYDAAMEQIIQDKWSQTLDGFDVKTRPAGKIKIQFELHSDGTISRLTVLDNKIGEPFGRMTQAVITGCAPFDPWPPAMVEMISRKPRLVTFTFAYYKK